MLGALKWILAGLVIGTGLSLGAVYLGATQFGSGGRVNVLLMGVDQRPDEKGKDPGRTDSMMLLSIDRRTSSAAAVSIPRDLWVPIPAHGEGRVNSAYRTGELAKAGTGPDLAKKTVASALGINIDRYVLVDMRGLQQIIDQVGGVDITVKETLVDDEFPTDDYGTRRLVIPAGRQHMDGATALAYARTRHQDSDFGRMARQQEVISALRARLSSPSGVQMAPTLMSTLPNAVTTDMPPSELLGLASLARSFSDDHLQRLVIGPELTTPVTGADGAALLQPTPRLKPTVAQLIAGQG
jgi:polyisoprenyl-teichoic acid--peptidoglycan teichoic acid transferase